MKIPAALPPTASNAWPLLGHAPQLALHPLAFFQRLHDHGPIVRIRMGNRPTFVVTRPDLVRRLMVTDQHIFEKGGPFVEKFRTFVGNGLATCPAADHAIQRPAMQPAFHHTRFPHYVEVMRQVTDEVTRSWQPGQTLRLNEEVHRITAQVTAKTLISAEEGGSAATQLTQALPDILRGLYWRMVFPGSLFPKIPLSVNRRFERQAALTRRAVDRTVTHYRDTGTDYKDLLSMVVTACEREIDPRQAVYDQVVSILTAGVETTASTVVWTLKLLDRHPPIAAQVQAELRRVLDGRQPDHDDLSRLLHTQHAITEALRLYPPPWLLSRATTAEVRWSEGHIPAGADVLFSPYTLHRDPKVFPDPETFDPDRWHPRRVTALQRQGFFGFGAGRRKCIGDTFGMAEATIAVATILNRWELRHQHGTIPDKPTARMLLIPPPTDVRVEPRRRAGG